jgi:Icc-related predicted phosphoesterase
MRILALSDVADERAYASVGSRAGRIDLILGCGDLPYDYLDYVATELGVPLFAVHGNHDTPPELLEDPAIAVWWKGINIHGRVVALDDVLVAGLGGSRRYNKGPYQLSEGDMFFAILRMIPTLIANRVLRGRALDVLVTHAPARGIHDLPDRAHLGFTALRWFLRAFRPRYHLHGHSHVYDRRTVMRTSFHDTVVVNAYGAREIELDGRR